MVAEKSPARGDIPPVECRRFFTHSALTARWIAMELLLL
jgi:hypothetical protein